MYCINGCCKLLVEKYIEKENQEFYSIYNKRKAGIVFIDKKNNSILIVQSRGNLWGFPKGTANENESFKECAIREAKEETGIELGISELNDYIAVRENAVYFFKVIEEREMEIQHSIENNDANGIGWIKIKCLEKMIENNLIKINSHCRTILERT